MVNVCNALHAWGDWNGEYWQITKEGYYPHEVFCRSVFVSNFAQLGLAGAGCDILTESSYVWRNLPCSTARPDGTGADQGRCSDQRSDSLYRNCRPQGGIKSILSLVLCGLSQERKN